MINSNTKNTKLVPAICTQCHGQLEVDPSKEIAVCKYCETSFFVEEAIHNYDVQNVWIEHVESVNIHKRGAVESALNFVEKQQSKWQQNIDDEKRRQEEAKKKQEEQRKNIIDQIINRKYLKRNLSILGGFVFIVLILIIMGATREKPNHEGEARTPSGSTIQKGKDYQDVIYIFEEKGFINVKTEVLDDLITGWITKDGEVESVSVDGNEDYSPDDWYPNDVAVIITYHTFTIVEEETTSEETTPGETTPEETTSVETTSVETTSVETPSVETPSVETPSVETTSVETTSVETPSSAESILEETFPKEMARRAVIVAFTNRDSLDVFTDDGNAYDPSKFHSYEDDPSLLTKVYSDGTWSAKDDTTWHVEDIVLKVPLYENYLKVSFDVTYDGSNYVVSNVKGFGGNLRYLDSGDLSKLDYFEENPSDFNKFLTVSPALVGEESD